MPAPLKSYIDRILNVLAEIDHLGDDKKEIYKELAGDGYDRTVVSQVVGHIRKKAAKPGKFAEQSALFDMYLTEYEGVGTRVATHAAREFADHITGEIIPSEAAMLPQTGGDAPFATTAGRVAVEGPATQSRPVVGADEAHAPYQSDNTAGTPLAGAGIDADRQPTNVTRLHNHNPATHFLSSKGLPRLHGCTRPDTCAGSHRTLCGSCAKAAGQGSAA